MDLKDAGIRPSQTHAGISEVCQSNADCLLYVLLRKRWQTSVRWSRLEFAFGASELNALFMQELPHESARALV